MCKLRPIWVEAFADSKLARTAEEEVEVEKAASSACRCMAAKIDPASVVAGFVTW
jgi:hypothetical protein